MVKTQDLRLPGEKLFKEITIIRQHTNRKVAFTCSVELMDGSVLSFPSSYLMEAFFNIQQRLSIAEGK